MLMLAIKRSADMKPLDQSGLWKIASLLLDDPPDLSISIVRGLKNLFLISIKKKHRHRRNIITAFFLLLAANN